MNPMTPVDGYTHQSGCASTRNIPPAQRAARLSNPFPQQTKKEKRGRRRPVPVLILNAVVLLPSCCTYQYSLGSIISGLINTWGASSSILHHLLFLVNWITDLLSYRFSIPLILIKWRKNQFAFSLLELQVLYRIHDQYHIASDPSPSFSSLILLLPFDLWFIQPVFFLFYFLHRF